MLSIWSGPKFCRMGKSKFVFKKNRRRYVHSDFDRGSPQKKRIVNRMGHAL